MKLKKSFESSDLLIFIGFIFSTYISFVVLYLSYDIFQSPDFDNYYNYFLYYSGNISKTNLEQGHFYYYVSYIVTLLISKVLTNLTTNELINLSIHMTNSFIYLFGIIGFYKLLVLKKFEKKISFLVLVSTTFLPLSIALRATFKPEILIF